MQIATGLSACVLRPWERGDVASLIRFANNRAVWRNLLDAFPHPYSQADAEQWVALNEGVVPCTHFAIELDRIAVGGIGLIPQDDVAVQTARLGYWLGEPFWGRGLATAAARALADHAFSTLPFARIEAGVFAWNPASMRVLEKAGFVREGVLRRSVYKDGQLIDSVMYARVRDA